MRTVAPVHSRLFDGAALTVNKCESDINAREYIAFIGTLAKQWLLPTLFDFERVTWKPTAPSKQHRRRTHMAATKPSSKTTESKRAYVSQSDIPACGLDQALRIPQAIADSYGQNPTRPLRVAEAPNMTPSTGAS